jgi:hypothetical protein
VPAQHSGTCLHMLALRDVRLQERTLRMLMALPSLSALLTDSNVSHLFHTQTHGSPQLQFGKERKGGCFGPSDWSALKGRQSLPNLHTVRLVDRPWCPHIGKMPTAPAGSGVQDAVLVLGPAAVVLALTPAVLAIQQRIHAAVRGVGRSSGTNGNGSGTGRGLAVSEGLTANTMPQCLHHLPSSRSLHVRALCLHRTAGCLALTAAPHPTQRLQGDWALSVSAALRRDPHQCQPPSHYTVGPLASSPGLRLVGCLLCKTVSQKQNSPRASGTPSHRPPGKHHPPPSTHKPTHAKTRTHRERQPRA